MRIRYGTSPWIHEFPESRRPSHPKFRGEQTADVVIVGAGLTGCATAYACAVAGARPLVLEADRIGVARSGHSSGLLLPDPGVAFKDIAAAHGLRAARRIFESWRRASLDAAALIRRLAIKAALEPRDSITAGGVSAEKILRREFDARVEAGLDARWLGSRQIRPAARLEASAALRFGDAFSVDPYRVCLGLAAAARGRGATFFERTALKKTRAGRAGVELTVDGGTIRTQTVIITTGSATVEFKPLRRHFKRRTIYRAMTEVVPAAIRKQLMPHDLTIRNTAGHRASWTRDDRLIVSGSDQDEVPARVRDAALVQRTGELMYELLKMYPAISGLMPEYGWDMTYGETADGLPYAGPHRNYPHHLFALGGGRDSITGAFLAARLLARTVAARPEKHDELFGFTR
jgi:glycine/D-amino acid oxidase-like deaminating enzyme